MISAMREGLELLGLDAAKLNDEEVATAYVWTTHGKLTKQCEQIDTLQSRVTAYEARHEYHTELLSVRDTIIGLLADTAPEKIREFLKTSLDSDLEELQGRLLELVKPVGGIC